MPLLFTASRRPALRALAAGFVPETAAATPEQWARLEAAIEDTLRGRNPAVTRQLVLLLRGVELAALLRCRCPITRLSAERRLEFLEGLARSRLLLLRRGIWGLRTLVMLGWYTQPGVAAALGYRAAPAGWDRT